MTTHDSHIGSHSQQRLSDQVSANTLKTWQLARLSAKTQEVYLQAITALVRNSGLPPRSAGRAIGFHNALAVRQRNARGTFKTCHYGIQFFYRNTLGKDWALFKKRSGSPSRSACRRRFPMPRSDAFWAASATRSTAAASA
jgi:hypothetical protein